MIKAIAIGITHGLAVLLIIVYTAGIVLVIAKIISPVAFLSATHIIAFIGFPFVLWPKPTQENNQGLIAKNSDKNSPSPRL